MSIMAESNVYESMADEGLEEKLRLAASGDPGAFVFIPKIERDVQPSVRDVSEEIAEEKLRILHDGITQDAYGSTEQPPIYFEETLSTCEEVEVDYKPSMTLPLNKMEDEWGESPKLENSVVDSSYEENHVTISSGHDDSENVEDSDEETIATFLTSAGQRLALYAVEDSDEVFAVAVYDESGEPPTNFQFLMKADVERLIGEGAVRTVKKPTQMKKQLFSTDPPVFAQHTEEPSVDELQLKLEQSEPAQYQNNHCNTHKATRSDYNDLSATEMVQAVERKSSPLPDADKQPDLTYLSHVTEDACPALARIEDPSSPLKATPTSSKNGIDFIEQSTVLHMLLGADDSDGELTLADVEESLKNHRPTSRAKSPSEKGRVPPVDSSLESIDVRDSKFTPDAAPNDDDDVPANPVDETTVCRSSSPSKFLRISNLPRKAATSLIRRRERSTDERSSVSSGASLLIASAVGLAAAAPCGASAAPLGSRVKRSRKQQLTSVNRDDSEIIIQPASFASEEDEPTRKRGRGRRKPGRGSAASKTKALRGTRRGSRTRRSQRARATVELIEIDVDEEHRLALPAGRDIVEITIDEGKEKGSSDKENEVIMVGDSEDEAREAEARAKSAMTSILKCEHCLRSFRQKRALETHSRVCPKSPEAVRRTSEKSARRSAAAATAAAAVAAAAAARSGDAATTAVKKQYSCKICEDKFDVVVALARHVRSMHSQRRKVNSGAQSAAKTAAEAAPKAEETTRKIREAVTEVTEVEEVASVALRRRRRTRTKTKTPKPSWKSNKLHCDDCGRWFTSDALLTAHSLQHATKKSEKQIRRCPTCKKIFKSRLLYIRHLRMHSRAKQLQKKLHHTRQASGKTTSVRKRGRPRKL